METESLNSMGEKVLFVNALLTNWFAQKNLGDTIIFIQYLLLFLFRFVQLLSIMCPIKVNSNTIELTVYPSSFWA